MRGFTFLIILLSPLFIYPSYASSEYKIVLKNGSSMIVDSYRKINGRIQFYKSGGMIEIDSSEVFEIKEKSSRFEEVSPQVSEREKEVPGEIASTETPSREMSDEELRNRIEEIQKEKETLKKEAGAITEEIEKLNTEIRREGRVLAIRKKRELTKRKEELERRTADLNRRIEELNKEEEDLLRRLWKY